MSQPLPLPDDAPAEVPLRLEQKRFGTRTFFEFGEEAVRYGLDDGGSARTWSVEYAEISPEREHFVERHPWWRNVGALWVLVGLVLMGIDISRGEAPVASIWLLLGLGCLGYYALRIRRYIVLPTPRSNLLVLEGEGSEAVIAEIDRRRAAQLRERFDYLSDEESPEQQRHRVLWLRKHGSLDDHEVSARLLQIDLMAQQAADGRRRSDDD